MKSLSSKFAFALTIAAFAAVACAPRARGPDPSLVHLIPPAGKPFLRANLKGVGAVGRKIQGEVRLVELRGVEGVQVQIDATGLTPGSHAWHIHEGTCANEGAVVLAFTNEAQNQYHNYGSDVLVAGDDGWIEKDAQISPARLTRRQLTAEPHTISIHLNLLPPDETMACADLKMK